MQIKKQLNTEIMNGLGIYGNSQSDIMQRLNKFSIDIDQSIDQRLSITTFDIYGLTIDLPHSVYTPVEILCSCKTDCYQSLSNKYNKELIKALVSHYLFNDSEKLNKDSGDKIIEAAKRECIRLKLVGNELEESATKYLTIWLIYKCNKIIESFIL